ncbi:MAG: hypothetical protein AAF909_15375, partial [Pseudomonadota bacterium]
MGRAQDELDILLGAPAPRPRAASGRRWTIWSKGDRARGRSAAGAARRDAEARPLNQTRFFLISTCFVGVMGAALFRFADMAAQGGPADEPAVAAGLVNAARAADLAEDQDARPARAPRALITDRNGAPLARDLASYELYLDRAAFAFPEDLAEAAETLARAFPERFEAKRLLSRLQERRTTLLARPLTAREAQTAHDLGVPGLYLTPRRDRVYPAGA